VVFGDVLLSSDQVRTIHGTDQSPGGGGWPTVRHFNKETGYGGMAYKQKTSEAMCDELGPKNDYMQQLVEEAAGTSLCNINKTDKGCSDKQKDFIAKWLSKPTDEIKKQLDRLKGMADGGSTMKPEAMTWMKHRIAIFKQLEKQGAKQEL